MECIFCKIVKNELPSFKVYEDEKSLAFLDIKPVSKGHTLLIPKAHYKNLSETPDELLAHLAVAAKRVAAAVVKAVTADAFNLSVNCGAAAGQIIFHTHFHIIPRFSSDRLSPWPHRQYSEGEAESIAEKIRAEIG